MNHGVFAPVYKVEILALDQEDEQKSVEQDQTLDEGTESSLLDRNEVTLTFLN